MRVGTGTAAAHLSYCTNVHAGRSWPEAFAALAEHVPRVRDAVLDGGRAPAWGAPAFGLGLRLSHEHLVALEAPGALERFRGWLDAESLYAFTVNGFPYGAFHGTAVKEAVYRPDWTTPERLDYTRRLATLLARLDPPEGRATISTLPGTFAAWARADTDERIARGLADAAVHCARLERETGTRVGIAIEPEPMCRFETVGELRAFFAGPLRARATLERVARALGTTRTGADGALRRHLGVCHDACHSAVEFEAPAEALAGYAADGIEVMKLQLSSALRLERADGAALEHLARFDEPVYLHQTVAREPSGRLRRHADLGEAFAARRSADEEWRVHFHVPVFLESMERFGTTQGALVELLALQRAHGVSPHLEIETYTWDVLPAPYRDAPVHEAIARELLWTRDRLEGGASGATGSAADGTGDAGPHGTGRRAA